LYIIQSLSAGASSSASVGVAVEAAATLVGSRAGPAPVWPSVPPAPALAPRLIVVGRQDVGLDIGVVLAAGCPARPWHGAQLGAERANLMWAAQPLIDEPFALQRRRPAAAEPKAVAGCAEVL